MKYSKIELKNIDLTDHGINRSRERLGIEEKSDFLFEARLKSLILNSFKNGNTFFENGDTIYLNSGIKNKKNKKEIMFVLKKEGNNVILITTKPSDASSNLGILNNGK